MTRRAVPFQVPGRTAHDDCEVEAGADRVALVGLEEIRQLVQNHLFDVPANDHARHLS